MIIAFYNFHTNNTRNENEERNETETNKYFISAILLKYLVVETEVLYFYDVRVWLHFSSLLG